MGATLFSGIDAPEVSAPAIDWLWRAEIDKFPNAVSKHRRPDTPNLGDVSAPDFVERALQHGRPDIIVFGSPCQSFSVAGKRLGLDDPRGNLALVALEVVRQLRPRWLVFENVPGLFSSEKGRDFAAFLETVEECGYLGAWRVLDAQFTGVPQRRRRLFFVGCLGDWRPAAAVLFEQSSLQGHPAPRREAGKRVADSLTVGADQCSGRPGDFTEHIPDVSPALKPRDYKSPPSDDPLLASNTVGTLTATYHKSNDAMEVDAGLYVAHSLRAEGFDASEDGTGRGTPLVPVGFYPTAGREFPVFDDMSPAVKVGSGGSSGNPPGVVAFETRFARNGRGAPDTVVPPLKAQSGQTGKGDAAPCVAYSMMPMNSGKDFRARETDVAQPIMASGQTHGDQGGDVITVAFNSDQSEKTRSMGEREGQTPTLRAGGEVSVATAMQVRRLTPRECERLQGFPDDYTQIPWRNKTAENCPDGPRYKALGNSMAVPVIGWILDRVQKVEGSDG
jgi:DNA (cytosine-5)-methyltransferase 1